LGAHGIPHPNAMVKHGCFVVLSIFIACGPASAEWVRVGGTHKFDAYADLATIGVTDRKTTMWTMKNFKIVRQIPRGAYRSLTIKKQYDRRNHQSRQLRSKYYTEPMAKGRLLFAGKGTKQWSRVIPGSDVETEWKIACTQA
jgi:hypothetical protein